MRRKDLAAKTQRIWKVDFTEYGDTIDHSPHDTIRPAPTDQLDMSSRQAIAVLQELSKNRSTALDAQVVMAGTIGSGAVGIIREAKQQALDRDVAVKMLRPNKINDAHIMDLLREAWVAGSLEHPNIVPVYDLLLDEKSNPIIVLKRIEGMAWSELINNPASVRERFGAEDLLEWNLGILLQVLNAVRFAHSRGIVHRDLKPANVMIGEFGEVYLVDWGLAVSTRDDASGRFSLARDAIALAGTPCYMAPEMLGDADRDSDLSITERTDIYLVGAILFEILAGEPPHMGKNSMQIVASVVLSDPDIPDHAPQRLSRIVQRAMDPDPHGRFENVEQVRLAIEGYLRNRGSERLCNTAEAALEELTAQLALEHTAGEDRAPSSDPEHRQGLYRLYGACRFGFREALATWSGNQAANTGLQRATLAMIEYELEQDDPRAAAALHADLPEPRPDVRKRIKAALAREAAEKRRSAQLEQLGKQLDLSAGRRGRLIGVLILGVCFALVPALFVWQFEHLVFRSHAQLTVWNGTFLTLTILVGAIMRRALRESAVNRRLYTLLLLLMVAQMPLELGLWQAGFTPLQSIMVHVFIWFFLATVVAFTFDRRLLPTAFGYLAAFLTIAMVPDIALYVVHIPHGLMTINAVLVWRS